MKPDISEKIVYHRTRARKPSIYPLTVSQFTVSPGEVPHDKALMALHCREGCQSYGRNGACPPHSPDFHDMAVHHRYATVVYVKLLAAHYPVRLVRGQPRTSWKYTESFLPAFLRRQVMALARDLQGLPMTSGRCTGCRICSFENGLTQCVKPEARTYSLGGCGVNVERLMEHFADISLKWWEPDDMQELPPYQVRVGMVLHGKSP